MEPIKKTFIVEDFYLRHINDDDDLSVAIAGYHGKDSHVIIPKCIQNLHVKAIDEIAFLSTSSIRKVSIEQGVTFIGNTAFFDCTELTEVELPEGLLKIDYEAFVKCKKLAKIQFPESLLSIGSHAFGDCEKLTSIFIPKKVQYLGSDEISGCFSGCSKLKEIIVDDRNPEFSSLDGVLFNKTKTLLIKYPEGKEDASYKVPDTVINIKDEAFNDCKKLIAVTFPDKFLSLPNAIFLGCIRLKKVTLSQETKIEPYAFLGSSVKYVTGIDKITFKKMIKKARAKSLKEAIEKMKRENIWLSMKMTENKKGEKKNMYKITLKKMDKKDFPLIKQWLESDKFRRDYEKSYTTIDQLKNKINGENSYIDFFMININSEKIGFCQYYDCFTAQKFCENIDKENIRYCIDYVMIKYIDGVYDQFEVVKKLIKIIKKKNGKEIILDKLGIKTLKAFIPNDFQFDKGNIYKIL